MGGKSSSAVRYPWLDPPFIGKSTSYPPCPRAGLVALRQTFVRRCHGGLGSPGLPGIDKSSMMAGKSALPWDVATSVQTDPPLFMRLVPELAGSPGRVDAGILPPRGFIVCGAPIDDGSSLALGPRPRLQLQVSQMMGADGLRPLRGRLVGRSARCALSQ